MRAIGLQGLRNVVRAKPAFASVCLLLALFVAQTAVTRGHFHFGKALDGTAIVDVGGDTARQGTQTPLPTHDESHCPLWHAAGVCGAVAAPDAVVANVPPAARLRIAVDERLIFPERFTAAWRSRAPPSL